MTKSILMRCFIKLKIIMREIILIKMTDFWGFIVQTEKKSKNLIDTVSHKKYESFDNSPNHLGSILIV